LAGNELRVSKLYSRKLLNQALKKPMNPRSLIALDLKRSFHYLWSSPYFKRLLDEAEIILQMWEVE